MLPVPLAVDHRGSSFPPLWGLTPAFPVRPSGFPSRQSVDGMKGEEDRTSPLSNGGLFTYIFSLRVLAALFDC